MKKVIYILFTLSISICTFAQGTQIHLGIPIYHTAGKVTIGNSDVPPLFLNRTGNGTHTVFQRSGSAKGYVGLSNSGTSFYLTSYSDFALRVNGSGNDSFYLSSAGNVGIGTTSPNDLLHISKTGANTRLRVGNNSAYDQLLYFNGAADWSMGMDNSNSNAFTIASTSSLDNSQRFTILSNGNTGVGTTAPASTLHVSSASSNAAKIRLGRANSLPDDYLEISTVGGGGRFTQTGGSIDFYTSTSVNASNDFAMRISEDGNVGIGATSPSHTLTIQGGPSGAKGINLMDGNSRIYFDGKRAMEGHFTNSRLDIGEGYSKAQIFGNVGIGTTSPSGKLHIEGDVFIKSGEKLQWGGSQTAIEGSTVSNKIAFFTNSLERFRIDGGGNVGIGTDDPTEKLSVDGTVLAKKVKVSTTTSDWPDFVFAPSYKLRSLAELEKFITDNHHLPEVPSAKEVEKDGLDLGKMDATLLQKVEELTLYLIDVNKKQEQLIKEVEDLKKENAALKKKVNGQ